MKPPVTGVRTPDPQALRTPVTEACPTIPGQAQVTPRRWTSVESDVDPLAAVADRGTDQSDPTTTAIA